MSILRRSFLASALTTTLGRSLAGQGPKRSRILLRSSWQTVNIGDIGHTPGVLKLLEDHLPHAEVRLWASDVRNGVDEMLRTRFPRVPIVQREDEIQNAIRNSDFLLHGSGPSLVASRDVKRWREQTGKPYGVFGITLSRVDEKIRDLLSQAKFVFFRDSVSLELAKEKGVRCPVMEFGPDGAFAVDVRNDEAAERFLVEHGLKKGRFLCCIPRYRYTPYWRIKNRPLDKIKQRRNDEMKEHDHAPLRAAVREVVRQTDLKVLLCPEDQTQMAIAKEMILDKLPPGIRRHVVWRDRFWLTDEAVSTYVRSAGLFGLEMHSPIMCIGNGIPAIVCRFSEQTSKGYMWRDIGLDEWLIDMDRPSQVSRIVPAVLEIAKNPERARAKTEQARAKVAAIQRRMVLRVGNSIG